MSIFDLNERSGYRNYGVVTISIEVLSLIHI